MTRLTKLLAVLLAFAMIAAACGGDDDDAAETEDPPAEEAEESSDDSAADDGAMEEESADDDGAMEEEGSDDGAAGEVSGDPILLGFIGTDVIAGVLPFDAMVEGFEAATLKINGEGGIDGRPIEVLTCADEGNPNTAADCAQQLIDDGVVAFVANFTPFGDAANPIINEAGLAVIGGGLFTAGDFGAPDYYATNGGVFTAALGGPIACNAAGFNDVIYAYSDVAAAAQIPALMESLVTAPNPDLTLVASEPVAPDLADFVPVAATIVGQGPNCIHMGIPDTQLPPLIEALRAQGLEGGIVVSVTFNTPESMVELLGEDSDNIVTLSIYDQSSEGWAEYTAAVTEMTGDDSRRIEIGVMAWLGTLIAADVLRAAGDDPAAITAAIPEVVVGWDTKGLTVAPLDWSVPGVNPLAIENVRDTSLIAGLITDGTEEFLGGWVPVFPG